MLKETTFLFLLFFFYTTCLFSAAHPHKKINNGTGAINSMGESCSNDIKFNLLEKLADYEKNPDYFQDTEIKSKEDAQRVFDALNNGSASFSICLYEPLFNVKNTDIIANTIKGAELCAYVLAALCLTAKYVTPSNSGMSAATLSTLAIVGPLSVATNVITKIIFDQSVQDGLFSLAKQKIISTPGELTVSKKVRFCIDLTPKTGTPKKTVGRV